MFKDPEVLKDYRREYSRKERLADPERKNAHQRVYYERNSERIKEEQRGRKKRDWKTKREIVDELKSVPCADCGNKFPSVCMDFDHIPERGVKLFNIASAIPQSISMERFMEEIAKCEVVCSNCHRIRTTTRGVRSEHWRPLKIEWPENESLISMINSSNYVEVAASLGVSDNAVRKHLKRQGLERVLTKTQIKNKPL
jgi:5-methylcytosine-specific restriction endonuclease McrA